MNSTIDSRLEPYAPPDWATGLGLVPKHRVRLAQTPTPIRAWHPGEVPGDCSAWIKRDDQTGITLSGNKARKLEFLLAQATENGCDTVITCGGIQSNHARATAVAARELGLDCHLVLNAYNPEDDPGLAGNLLLDRLVGAKLHVISWKDYQQRDEHMAVLARELEAAGKRPCLVPEGGSNALGTWGYIEAVREIAEQLRNDELRIDDIFAACGSGGTAAGLGLGVALCGLPVRVHVVNVCWDADHFYDRIDDILRELGAPRAAREIVDVVDGHVGQGYAKSTPEELAVLRSTARETGVILDPVYTVKAFCGMCAALRAGGNRLQGNHALFIHTGGLFGLYDKLEELAPVLT
jgi:D-cysteine desulfhydrase